MTEPLSRYRIGEAASFLLINSILACTFCLVCNYNKYLGLTIVNINV